MAICTGAPSRALLIAGICLYGLLTITLHQSGVAVLNGSSGKANYSVGALENGYSQSPIRQQMATWPGARLRSRTNAAQAENQDVHLLRPDGLIAEMPQNVAADFSLAAISLGLQETSLPLQALFLGSRDIASDIMLGLRQVLYAPFHRSCLLQECASFTAEQGRFQAAAQLALLMPSAPRIIRSPAVSKSGLWGGDGTFLHAPAWLLQHDTASNSSQLEQACSRLQDCDGFLPSLGLLAGISAASRVGAVVATVPLSLVPANSSTHIPLPPGGMHGVQTLAPTTADLRLAPARPEEQTDFMHAALRSFAGLPMMRLVGSVEIKANLTAARTSHSRLASIARECLARAACVGFSSLRWTLLEYPAADVAGAHRQAAVLAPPHASATTTTIARTLSLLTLLDQTRMKVFDIFLRLPDPSAAVAVLKSFLAKSSPRWQAFGSYLAGAAERAHSTAAEAALDVAKPDEPCPQFRMQGSSPAVPAACVWLVEADTLMHYSRAPAPVLQAVRDLYAVIALRGASTAYVVSSAVSFLVESSMCDEPRAQLFLGEIPSLRDTKHAHTTHRGIHTVRMLFDAAYAPAFGSLAWRPAPCLTVLGVTQYSQLQEAAKPPHAWGEPWLPPQRRQTINGAKRIVKRRLVQQDLDFVGLGAAAAARSPTASLAVWEDDCAVCPGTVAFVQGWMKDMQELDPQTAMLKVGNGGSGVLVPQPVVWPLLAYMASHRGRENVDVLMYLFALDSGWSDYLGKKTLSAHRGRRTSLKISNAFTPVWGRVECGNALDFYWGEYEECGNSTTVSKHIATAWRCPKLPREEAEPLVQPANATIHS